MDRAHTPIDSLLEQATGIVRRSKATAGTSEPAEGYKRKQTEELIRFADSNNLWINIQSQPFIYLDKGEEFCAVLTQPYIKAEREATEEEIATYMQALGFTMDYYDEFHNNDYKIFDAAPNNVLYGIDGDLYFIDTQIRTLQKHK